MKIKRNALSILFATVIKKKIYYFQHTLYYWLMGLSGIHITFTQ